MELLEIAKLPTAENSAIHLNPLDNVAIARVPLPAGRSDSPVRAIDRPRQDFDRTRPAYAHTQRIVRGARIRIPVPGWRDSLPCAAQEHADFSRLSARGWARRHAQL